MKATVLFLLSWVSWSVLVAAPVELQRGPHHRTWGRITETQTAAGIIRRTNSTVVELEAGMHKFVEGQGYVAASPRIAPFQDGAVVTGLQYSVIFAPNLASQGAVDLQLPDGQRLTGQLLGLVFTEGNQSVLIAPVQDCSGVIAGPEDNELTYEEAMPNVDVKYVVERGRFAQELIVKRQLPTPQDYPNSGLTDDAHLEIWSQWTSAPVPDKETRVVEPAVGNQHALTDERISLGSMDFVSGHAFILGDTSTDLYVCKTWEVIGNQTYLVEKIPWRTVKVALEQLPVREAKVAKPDQAMASVRSRPRADVAKIFAVGTGKRPTLKAIHYAAANGLRRTERAELRRPLPAIKSAAAPQLVLDYELNTSVTNYTFKSDTTYYLSGSVSVKTAIVENCVIKLAPTNSAQLKMIGPVTCKTDPYRPCVITARDDQSIGESIGSASPSGYYGLYGLYLDYGSSGVNYDLRYVFVRHQQKGIYMSPSGGTFTLTHCQISSCSNALTGANATVNLRNALVNDNYIVTDLPSSLLSAENVTFQTADGFGGTVPTLTLTNCLLGNINSSFPSFSGANNSTGGVGVKYFQAVGGGAHYLKNGSTNRNSGTTSINADLLADLRCKTTYPPIVLSNTYITVDTTLVPQAQRDTDTIDRGYHYEPVDYALYQVVASNVNLTIGPGVAIASVGNYGLLLDNNTHLYAEGSPLQMIAFAHYLLVQEHTQTNWDSGYWGTHLATPFFSVSTVPEANVRFALFSMPPGFGQHLYADSYGNAVVRFRDCQFYNGQIYDQQPTLLLTNCLLARVASQIWDVGGASDVTLRHNTAYGGTFDLLHIDAGTWAIKDNIFDRSDISDNGISVPNDYNGYTTNITQLSGSGGHDVTLSTTNIAYEATALNRFYIPSTLLFTNRGSMNANTAGLWHYTCTTNQVKETNSVVDIGFHLVSLNANLSSLTFQDSDGDGTPDYLEDLNGNGTLDWAETSVTNATDVGLKITITNPRNGSTLP